MLEFNQPRLYEQVEAKMPNLSQVLSFLNEEYNRYLRGKYPEKDMNNLQQEFVNKSELVKKPITLQEFSAMALTYS